MPRETANEHVRNCLMVLAELNRRLRALDLLGPQGDELLTLVAAAQRRCWGALSELEPGPSLHGPDV